MVKKVQLLVVSVALVLALNGFTESTTQLEQANKTVEAESEIPVSTEPTKPETTQSTRPVIGELSNDALLVKLNSINEMTSAEQRELLIEIQRRILEEGPEPFIREHEETAQNDSEPSDEPKLEDETIKLVTGGARNPSTEEYVRDPNKANVKKAPYSRSKRVPYGSAYNE